MNKKYFIASIIIICAVAYLIFSGFNSAGVYYMNVDELLAKSIPLVKDLRLSGLVETGSVKREDSKKMLYFALAGEKGDRINVVYEGIIPDSFKEGVGVIVEGKYTKGINTFYAHSLLAKCPSKYESKIEKDN